MSLLPVNKLKTKNSVSDVSTTNPLFVEAVLDYIFNLLGLKDLKNCRLVCKTWKVHSEPHFKMRARILFPPWKLGKRNSLENIEELAKAFPTAKDKDIKDSFIPFTAITFRGKISESFLKTFFNSATGSSIRDVEFDHVRVITKKSKYSSTDTIDYGNGNWSNEFNISGIIPRNIITRLCVKDFYFDNVEMPKRLPIIVELSGLANCETISLFNCCILLNRKLRPTKITIKGCKFKNVGEFLINDFVDFTICDEVHLENFSSKLKLDMGSSKIKLKKASLTEVVITNWKNSPWNIENLTLNKTSIEHCHLNLIEKTKLNIKYLELISYRYIDLKALPLSVERLTLDLSFYSVLENSENFSTFPNLKFLRFVIPIDSPNISFLKLFKNCTSLQDLEVEESLLPWGDICTLASGGNLYTDYIPNSVRRLSLKSVTVSKHSSVKNKLRSLDTLVLSSYDQSKIFKIVKSALQVFEPKIIVIRNYKNIPWTKQEFKVVLDSTKFDNNIQMVIMGPISVSISSIEGKLKTGMEKTADLVLEYYRKSKSDNVEKIEEREFKTYCNFC